MNIFLMIFTKKQLWAEIVYQSMPLNDSVFLIQLLDSFILLKLFSIIGLYIFSKNITFIII